MYAANGAAVAPPPASDSAATAPANGDAAAPPATKKPVIRPFAVMRLCHEAIRVLLKRMSGAAAGGDKAACRAAFEEFEALVAIHMKQEDTELFSMLDRVSDGSVTAAGLAHEHEADAKQQAACRDALRDDSTAAMAPVIEAFVASHEAHLAHEEAGTCVCVGVVLLCAFVLAACMSDFCMWVARMQ